jgi:hypothetical protein
MNNISAYPLQWPEGWPRTSAYSREWGQFKGTPDKVRRELIEEINSIALGKEARFYTIRDYVVISTNVPLRRDGEPRADARAPEDPGVAVYFNRKKKPVCFACDKFDAVWKNMRAIQKTIEALRGIERWGSSQLLERAFTGFAALPPKSGPSCWELLKLTPTATEEQVLCNYRLLAMTAHPDTGGSTEQFVALTEAKDIALATIRSRTS